jgi:hypothetical protein
MQAAKQKAEEIPQMTVALSRAGAGLSVFFLALGFASSGLWAGTAAVLAVGALWLLGHLRGPGQPGVLRWTSSAAFAMQAIAAAVAVWMEVWAGWPLLGLVAALVTWDLDQFAWRMRAAGRVDDGPGLERLHIQRLSIVAGIGCLLAAAGLVVRVRLSFGLALFLAAVAMLGLSLVIGTTRRAGD